MILLVRQVWLLTLATSTRQLSSRYAWSNPSDMKNEPKALTELNPLPFQSRGCLTGHLRACVPSSVDGVCRKARFKMAYWPRHHVSMTSDPLLGLLLLKSYFDNVLSSICDRQSRDRDFIRGSCFLQVIRVFFQNAALMKSIMTHIPLQFFSRRFCS